MNDASIYIAAAIAVATLCIYLAARRKPNPAGAETARNLISSLDIEAFRNLVDPEEESFLRSNLTADQFRTIKRERAWAALAYVRILFRIAPEFTHFGNALQSSSDPRLVDLGQQMVGSAVNLRLYALQASTRLLVAATFPRLAQRPPLFLFEQYTHTAGLLLRYGALDHARKQYS
jgi:hypothetical protein